ncbi:MAG: DUF4911 domain-containing protein [Fusobacteria bacterium]|nr:DUF4911 domain-containing protein [Fusobacteriota bacterium]
MKEIELLVSTQKRDIDFISKIVEGYDGIATVRTIDASLGKIKILTFEHFKEVVLTLLADIKETQNVCVDSIEVSDWNGEL